MFGPKNRHGHVATGKVLGESGCWGLTFKMLMVDICFWELKLLPLGQRRLTFSSTEILVEVAVNH